MVSDQFIRLSKIWREAFGCNNICDAAKQLGYLEHLTTDGAALRDAFKRIAGITRCLRDADGTQAVL